MSPQNYTMLACFFTFMWSQFIRAIFFSVVPVAAKEWGLTPVEAGTLLSFSFFGYSGAVWLSGFLPGKRKHVIAIGGGISLAALILMQVTAGYWAMLPLAALMSAGAGLYLPRGVSLVSDASTLANKARNMSLHELAAMVGIMVGPLYASLAIKHLYWKDALLSGAAFTVFCVALVLMIQESATGATARQSAARVPIDRKLFAFALTIGSAFVMLAGLISVFPLLMVQKFLVDPSFAASYVGFTRILGLGGPVLSGILANRLGPHRSLYLMLGVCGVCLVVMSVSGFNLGFTAALLLMTLIAAGTTPLLYGMVAEAYLPEQKDRAFSLVLGLAQFFGMVGAPMVFGYLIGQFPAGVTFAVAAAAVFAGLGGIWDVSRHERAAGAVPTERS